MIPLHTEVRVKSKNHWCHGKIKRHSKKCKFYEIEVYPDNVVRGGWMVIEDKDKDRIEVVEQLTF